MDATSERLNTRTLVQAVRACGRAGYGDNSSVRFGGRWVETYTSDGATRRPSTLYPKPVSAKDAREDERESASRFAL
jgi:hypothetical protein